MIPSIAQRPAVVSESIAQVELRVAREQVGHVAGNHQVSAGRNGRIGRKIKIDATGYFPSREAHRIGAAIEKLDILIRRIPGQRVIHDFVDDDLRKAARRIWGTGGGRLQISKGWGAIRTATGRRAQTLGPKSDRI